MTHFPSSRAISVVAQRCVRFMNAQVVQQNMTCGPAVVLTIAAVRETTATHVMSIRLVPLRYSVNFLVRCA